MNPCAELVRSLLRWSLGIVRHEDTKGVKFPGPRLSQSSLGSMMSRTDLLTALQIAEDINSLRALSYSGETMEEVAYRVRTAWGQESRTYTRRTGLEDRVIVASTLCTALWRFGGRRDQSFMEICSSMKTWTSIAAVMPGRDLQSIKDDFERSATAFYRKETFTVCQTAEFVAREAESRRKK